MLFFLKILPLILFTTFSLHILWFVDRSISFPLYHWQWGQKEALITHVCEAVTSQTRVLKQNKKLRTVIRHASTRFSPPSLRHPAEASALIAQWSPTTKISGDKYVSLSHGLALVVQHTAQFESNSICLICVAISDGQVSGKR